MGRALERRTEAGGTSGELSPSPDPYTGHHWVARLRWVWWTALLLGPVAFLLHRLDAPPTLVFALAGLGTLPAAALLGRATEEIAASVSARGSRKSGVDAGLRGAKIGGLVNATFGNIPELIVGVLALQHGYLALVKATIIGSVIGNVSLILGLALLMGGIRHGVQRFDTVEVGHHAVLMTLAVASLALPSLFLMSTHGSHISEISVMSALVLLAVYIAYLLYSMFGFRGGEGQDDTFIEEETRIVHELQGSHAPWTLRRSASVLAAATLLLFAASEALIGTVEPFTLRFGRSPVFVGIVVVPVLANVAEHSSALLLAYKNRTDMVFGVASGSSIQIALFVSPLLVFLSYVWHPLDLTFNAVEIAALGVAIAIFYLVSRDGESNWLEGMQLVALYVLAAIVFFYMPGQLA